ncbi:MAG: PGF-pre-PGF domain-containing protein, partial [Methanoregula sp.]
PVDTDSLGYGHGSLDQKRYDWLVNELEKGQREGKLMIISAHIPIGVRSYPDMAGWSKYAYVSQDSLIAKLKSYPNLVLWISGHLHLNQVTAFASDDPNRPEYGFWEVQTSSLRDYPQNYRTFDIERNTDNSVSVFITDMDPSVGDGSLAEKSRSYGVVAQETDLNPLNPSPKGIYNAELVKQLSPEMQEKIGNLFTTPVVNNGGDDSGPPTVNPVDKTITETVNVGGGSAVTKAEMTGVNLGKNLVITAMPRSNLPAAMAAPPTTVYQYISITSSTIPGVVDHTVFDFNVPQSWLTEHGFSVGDIVMMHNVDGQWQTLGTRFVSQSNGNVLYESTTPSFSYFAIAYQKGNTTMAQGTPVPTVTTTTTTSVVAKTPVTGTPRLPVAITTKETQTPAPAPITAPVEGTPLTLIIIGVVGAIAIIAGTFLVRRWWIRRQNPALFRNYD